MAKEYRYGGHSVHGIQYHLCWCTKYRYPVLCGELGERCRMRSSSGTLKTRPGMTMAERASKWWET
jgi:hypothetical protein